MRVGNELGRPSADGYVAIDLSPQRIALGLRPGRVGPFRVRVAFWAPPTPAPDA